MLRRGRSLRFLIALVTFTWNFEKCLAAKRPQLAPLYSYVNTHSGPFRDHYATTWTPATYPEALSGYSLLDNFGLIGVEQSESEDEGKKAEECSCLQEIVQLFDQQVGLGATPQNPGLFGRVDHKFAKAGDEANMLFQKYERTGEKLFCATTMGECGATVPLYQWFVAPEVDTLYTTRDVNDAAVTNMVPQGILCYIWPGEMKDEDCAHQAATHQHQIDSGVISYGFNTEVTEDTKNVKGCDLNKLTTDHGQWATTRPDVTPGTVAVLNCDSGFVASQTPTIAVCQRSGDWMPPSGTCRMAGCEGPTNWKSEYGDITFSMEALRNPTDGSDLNIYPIGTTAMLVCDKTSDVIEREADIVYCSESGWAPRMLGRCYKVCPEFNISHGQVEYSNSDGIGRLTKSNGTVATLICGPGTKLDGSGTAVCNDGAWDNLEIGKCDAVGCPPLSSIDNGVIEYATGARHLIEDSPKSYDSGSRAHLVCKNGTRVKGGHEAVCQCNEQWKPNLGKCT